MKRRVLVTGASRGIGRAIALRLAGQGFAVTVHYRSRRDAAEKVIEELRGVGGEGDLLGFDVADREAAATALTGSVKQHGAYYGVVANAGVTADMTFAGMSGESWDRVLRTNLDGFYNVVKPLVIPMVRGRRGGRIVTLSSIAGLRGNRGQVNYSASKAGLIGATRALSLELASRGITCNCVAPGLIETEMTEGLPAEALSAMIPMQRFGTPEEVAAVVGFLVSDEASYVTGEVISVNGGMGG